MIFSLLPLLLVLWELKTLFSDTRTLTSGLKCVINLQHLCVFACDSAKRTFSAAAALYHKRKHVQFKNKEITKATVDSGLLVLGKGFAALSMK